MKFVNRILPCKSKEKTGTSENCTAIEWANQFLATCQFFKERLQYMDKEIQCPKDLNAILCHSKEHHYQKINWEGQRSMLPDTVDGMTGMRVLVTFCQTTGTGRTHVLTMNKDGDIFLCDVSYLTAVWENDATDAVYHDLCCVVLSPPSAKEIVKAMEDAVSNENSIEDIQGELLIETYQAFQRVYSIVRILGNKIDRYRWN